MQCCSVTRCAGGGPRHVSPGHGGEVPRPRRGLAAAGQAGEDGLHPRLRPRHSRDLDLARGRCEALHQAGLHPGTEELRCIYVSIKCRVLLAAGRLHQLLPSDRFCANDLVREGCNPGL